MRTFGPRHHFVELDSVRGLAAITVLIGHVLNLFRVESGPYVAIGKAVVWAESTPLFALFAGAEAVQLFFVLSGFVLSLQFIERAPPRYPSFLVKRLARLYLPYLFALGLALAACATLYDGPVATLSAWFNYPWSGGIDRRAVLDHVLFLGSYRNDRFDPVIWSLIHELRISLFFPWLALGLLRLHALPALAVSLCVTGVGMVAGELCARRQLDPAYVNTLRYTGFFGLGLVTARNVEAIHAALRARSSAVRIAVALLGFSMYTFGHMIPGRWRLFSDIPVACGATLLLITALCSVRASRVLRSAPAVFFGNISYSLYLLHAIVLLGLVHALDGRLPLAVTLALVVAVSVVLSALAYRFVELPAMAAGRALARRLD